MQLRWTELAASDLERIAEHLFVHVPERAPGLVRSIYEAPEALLAFPHRGRPGKKSGTRELIPTGVRMPVVNMSVRALIGMIHAVVVPGSFSASFICWTSSSVESRYPPEGNVERGRV